MKIKKDDNVIVISGKDRGKTGKIVRAFPREDKVIVSGLNIRKVHKRATKQGQKGQVVEKSFPMHVSNVQLVDPKTSKPTRIGFDIKGEKKIRVAKKSGSTIK